MAKPKRAQAKELDVPEDEFSMETLQIYQLDGVALDPTENTVEVRITIPLPNGRGVTEHVETIEMGDDDAPDHLRKASLALMECATRAVRDRHRPDGRHE